MINESGDQSSQSMQGGTHFAGTAEDLISDSNPNNNASGLQTDSEYANDPEVEDQDQDKGRNVANNFQIYKKEKTMMPKDFGFP